MEIFALWCHPRSVSTAFERVMRARGDLKVLHEPFMYHHYLNRSQRLFPDFEPDPEHPQSYGDIRAMILKHAAAGPVFFKDMAYYVTEDLPSDRGLMAAISHAFLIRDPAEAILSYHRRDPGFTCTELGHEAQFRLYEALAAAGHEPLVLRSDRLRSAPRETMARYWSAVGLSFAEHAFAWDGAVPEDWRSVAAWHSDVLSQGAIMPPRAGGDAAAELAALGPRFTEIDRHHRPYYEALCEIADAAAHQK